MADLALIKQRYEKAEEIYSKTDPKILEQMWEYHRHRDLGVAFDRIDELEQEMIGNE